VKRSVTPPQREPPLLPPLQVFMSGRSGLAHLVEKEVEAEFAGAAPRWWGGVGRRQTPTDRLTDRPA